MVDNRFDGYPVDDRFKTPGVDDRFLDPGVDARFPAPGEDARFMILVPVPGIVTAPVIGGVVGDENTLTLTVPPVWSDADTAANIWQSSSDGVNWDDIVGSELEGSIILANPVAHAYYRYLASATNTFGTATSRSNTLALALPILNVDDQDITTDDLEIPLAPYVNSTTSAITYGAAGSQVAVMDPVTGVLTMSATETASVVTATAENLRGPVSDQFSVNVTSAGQAVDPSISNVTFDEPSQEIRFDYLYEGADTVTIYVCTGNDPMIVTAAQLEAQAGGTNTSEFANQPNFTASPFVLTGFNALTVDVSALVAIEDNNGGESTVEQVAISLQGVVIPADAFVFEVTGAGAWQTPLYTGQSFACDVDWGDGTAVETMADEFDAKWNHTFVGAGPHTVIVTGTFGGLLTNNADAGVVARLTRILQNGTTGLAAQNNAYRGSALLTYKGTPGTVGTTPSIVAWFRDSADMTDCDLNGLSLANTTSLNSTFRGCTSLVNLDLTGNGIVVGSTVLNAFYGVAATTIPGIETIDTTTCTNFQDVFRDTGLLVLPAWSFAAATNCTGLAVSSGMTTVGPNIFDDTPCINFTNAWSGAALTQQSIDNVLASLVAAGQSSGTLNLAVVGGVVPSAAGLVDKAILVDTRSWLVTDNTV